MTFRQQAGSCRRGGETARISISPAVCSTRMPRSTSEGCCTATSIRVNALVLHDGERAADRLRPRGQRPARGRASAARPRRSRLLPRAGIRPGSARRSATAASWTPWPSSTRSRRSSTSCSRVRTISASRRRSRPCVGRSSRRLHSRSSRPASPKPGGGGGSLSGARQGAYSAVRVGRRVRRRIPCRNPCRSASPASRAATHWPRHRRRCSRRSSRRTRPGPAQALPAPVASVTYGSAGLAYGLLRLARVREDPELLALADLWSERAGRGHAQQEGAFSNAELEISSRDRRSLFPVPHDKRRALGAGKRRPGHERRRRVQGRV